MTVEVLVASGVEARRLGDLEEAEKAFRQVLGEDPTEPRAVRHLGAILSERGEIEAAIELFEAALVRVGPPSASTLAFYNNYANALRCAKRYSDAEEILYELVSFAPDEWQPWHNLGQTLRDMERFDEAAAAIRRAIALEPGFAPNHGVLGDILVHLGQLDSALVALHRCVDLGPRSDPAVWSTIGAAERLLGRLDEALETFEHALELSGPTPDGHRNVADVLSRLGRLDEAIAQLDAAVATDREVSATRAHRGYVLLAAGRIAEGWDEWEHGLECGMRGTERKATLPRWTLDDVDARVLVYREQGVGDELMFASCYPDVIAAAREVVIECEPRLASLFARSFPEAEIRSLATDQSGREMVHGCDRAIPAGSLPRIFRRSLDDFPDRRVVVKADPDRVAEWRDRLQAAGAPPYVGIAWRSRVMTVERRLDYTRLEEWDEVFAVPRVTWVNLQYDDCEMELRDAEARFGSRLHRWDWLDLMNDLDQVAALTAALDLVVSPRSAVSMLSGALGVDTIAFANRYSWADLGTDRLPWLPAVRMLYREPRGRWAPVLSAAAYATAVVAERAAA